MGKLWRASALALAAAWLYAPAAVAQEAQGEEAAGALDDIVVTARRMSAAERAQDIPLSITALRGDALTENQVATLADVSRLVPAARLNDNGTMPGTANFLMRGMGFFGSIPSDEPAVGVFLDGVYLGVNSGVLGNLDAMESVEVLRGPQGTLFGRNVTGGAIVLRSRRPTDEFEFDARVSAGEYESRRASFFVGGPVAPGFDLSLAGSYRENGDMFENRFPGGQDRGESDAMFIRPVAVFQPFANADLTLIYEHQEYNSDGLVAVDLLADIVLYDLGDFEVTPNTNDTFGDFRTDHFTAELVWDIGPGVLTAVAGWRDTESEVFFDADNSSRDLLAAFQNVYQDQRSLEVRYAWSPTDAISATIGAYYFDQNVENRELRVFGALAGNARQAAAGLLDASSAAVFAQGDIRFAENFVLTLGGRYTTETKDAQVASFPASLATAGDCNPTTLVCNFAFQDEEDWGYFSGLAALRWHFSDNAQAYISITRGQRSGGYNLRNSLSAGSTPGPYDEEVVDAIEAGVKSEFFDRRVRINASIYNNSYADLQRTVFAPGGVGVAQIKLNAADATIRGFELETSALLTDRLTFDGWIAYTDASYDEFRGFDVNGDGVPDPDLAKELDFASVPAWSAFAQLTYEHPFDNGATLRLRGSVNYADSRFGDERNTVEIDSYVTGDASAALTLPGDQWTLTVFGRNLADEMVSDFVIISSGIRSLWAPSAPRMFGVELAYSY